MSKRFLSIVFPALFLAAGLAPAAYGQFDQIYLSKGTPSRGTVTAMGKDQVTLDMSGVSRPFQVNEIVRISYADEPNELTNARNAVLQRNWKQALAELQKLDGQTDFRDLVKQDIDYYKALSLARSAMSEGGDKNAAAAAMLGFARSAPNNYHFYDAAEVLGDLALASGKYADAAKYYNSLTGAPWGDVQMRANNAVGNALIAQKDFPQALERYEAVLGTDLNTAEAAQQKLFATIGKAHCLGESGKADEGIAMLQDVIAKNDPQDSVLFGRAYNALGNCYLKANKPKEALQAFLHTDVLFYADSNAHAEALYRLSKLWNDVNKADRAVAARNTLRERYAGSVWASQE
jgi:tetratricopeptide (TPR) repeat protein